MCPHVVSGAGRWREGKVEGGWLAAHLLRTGGMACMCMCRSGTGLPCMRRPASHLCTERQA